MRTVGDRPGIDLTGTIQRAHSGAVRLATGKADASRS